MGVGNYIYYRVSGIYLLLLPPALHIVYYKLTYHYQR